MFRPNGKNGGSSLGVPSEEQARDKLIVYVYEYLAHMGAPHAAEAFLNEIKWGKGPISTNEPPGFLTSWWCVFWDLYCAAPERRESNQNQHQNQNGQVGQVMPSKEAISFHEYQQAGVPSAGYGPLSPNHINGMSGMPHLPPAHPHHRQGMVDGPGLASSPQMGTPGSSDGGQMPPGFFPGPLPPPPPPHMRAGPMMGPPPPSTLQQQQQQQQAQSAHLSNGPGGNLPNSPHPGMMMQPGGGPGQFMRSPFPGQGGSNRSSPATRMGHPGQQQLQQQQQQMEFGGPPGSMMMSDGSMMMGGRGGGNRGGGGGMPSSPMPGGYGGPPPPMHRMSQPGASSPSNSLLMSPMHQQQQSQRQPWQHPGAMGHYSTPSPPNSGYMSMMGPPPHMQQSPSHESVMSGGSDSLYGMMKGPDRFGQHHSMGDPTMNALAAAHEMTANINGEGMELKHSPSMNGADRNNSNTSNSANNMDSVDNDPYSISQFSAAAASASTTSSE